MLFPFKAYLSLMSLDIFQRSSGLIQVVVNSIASPQRL
jgi:hypothetical protein